MNRIEEIAALDPVGDTNPSNRLKKLYVFALALIACLTISSQIVIQSALHRQDSDAPVINVAGRQRMLSQRLTKTALALQVVPDEEQLRARTAELREVIELWSRSHETLQHGDTASHLPGNNSPRVAAGFARIEPHYRAMYAAALALLATTKDATIQGLDRASMQDDLAVILEHESGFLRGMNDIVFSYDTEAQTRVNWLKHTELILMSITLVVLLLEGLLVFRPGARLIHRQFSHLQRLTQDIQQRALAVAEEMTAELTRSEARTRASVETAIDGIITIDEDGVIDSFNAAAERIFGYSADDIVGENVTLLIPKSLVGAHSGGLRRYLETGQPHVIGQVVEVVAQRKDGSEVPVSLAISEICGGRRRAFTGILRDITDRKRAELEHDQMHAQLVAASRQAGMAEVATGVLHNVGNVLNSVNVTAILVRAMVQDSKAPDLLQISRLLQQHADDLGSFITTDAKGRLIPAFLSELGGHLVHEQATIVDELQSLTKNIEHIKEIVNMQQSFAKVSGVEVAVSLADLVEDALRINIAGLNRQGAQVVREFQAIPDVLVDKQRVLQILVNLISNAKYALTTAGVDDKTLTVRIATSNDEKERVRIDVIDNGVGIPPENLTRVFSHGFTTKQDGHGFGLHSCALAAQSIGGSLTVQSDGLNRGAAFSLHIPLKVAEVSR